ncbi:hypothetical protein KIH39_10220 [Telmatocola sphagniphila]|uniref:Uncharacterized protein n=1 Tax=Telmatocola sphagniphila TaxID=1123043 RepID=A0A8E6F090_9BACT|nr:hypothetical protein [Telmatocola sphagniphila]QVL34256.1 hypothetical protein KIH39_10220 [Telmatocola sphagniphila]
MSTSDSEWREEDFHAPPARNFEELVDHLESTVSAGQAEPAAIEDLRLYILVRMYQGFSQREIEAEMESWGLSSDFARGIYTSTRSEGEVDTVKIDGVECLIAYEEVQFMGLPGIRFANPMYAKQIREIMKANRRHREARRMLEELTRGNETANLGFVPDASPIKTQAVHRQAENRRIVWLMVMLLILSSSGLGILWKWR